MLETAAGILNVEVCVLAHVDAAIARGAKIHSEEPVRHWSASVGGVEVVTEKATYRAGRLVVTAGAWSAQLLADLGIPLTLMRQVMFWFETRSNPAEFRRDRFPIFIADSDSGLFYGLPAIDSWGVKVVRHYGAPEVSSTAEIDRDVNASDRADISSLVNKHLPSLGPSHRGQVCMYTLTPDRHFAIGIHPTLPNVVVACGFSGHGFKFASVVGEILADLAIDGTTKWGIGQFALVGRS